VGRAVICPGCIACGSAIRNLEHRVLAVRPWSAQRSPFGANEPEPSLEEQLDVRNDAKRARLGVVAVWVAMKSESPRADAEAGRRNLNG